MSSRDNAVDAAQLRAQAVSRLAGRCDPDNVWPAASSALGVLHGLASSPSTAADALALLHELQVHQVELELQAEELRRSRAELELELKRHTQLHEFAPVGCFEVDSRTHVRGLNLAGARLFGVEREDLLGRMLDSLMSARSGDALHTLLARIGAGHFDETCMLDIAAGPGGARRVHATACADPAGSGYLLALVAIDGA
jgi:PAS domain-containing protein